MINLAVTVLTANNPYSKLRKDTVTGLSLIVFQITRQCHVWSSESMPMLFGLCFWINFDIVIVCQYFFIWYFTLYLLFDNFDISEFDTFKWVFWMKSNEMCHMYNDRSFQVVILSEFVVCLANYNISKTQLNTLEIDCGRPLIVNKMSKALIQHIFRDIRIICSKITYFFGTYLFNSLSFSL